MPFGMVPQRNTLKQWSREETLENFDLVMLKVSGAVFPIRSYLTQKQAMHQFMHKPKGYEYLWICWSTFGDQSVFRILSKNYRKMRHCSTRWWNHGYGIPNTWQKRIVELNFDAQAHTPNEFFEMCEHISYSESSNEETMSNPKVAFQEHNNKRKNNKRKPPTANPMDQSIAHCTNQWSWCQRIQSASCTSEEDVGIVRL